MAEAEDDNIYFDPDTFDEVEVEPPREVKSDEELISILEEQVYRALNDEGGDVSDIREQNLSRYRGDGWAGDEELTGVSKLVSRESFEAIEWALPVMLKPFVTNSKIVEFEATSQEDEAQADQERDIVNYYALKRNNGFLTLYSFTKDLLMYPNAYVKIYEKVEQRRTFTRYNGLTMSQVAEFDQNPEYTLLEAGDVYVKEVEVEGQVMPLECIDVRVQRDWVERKKVWEPVPPDEMLVAEDLTQLDLDESDFICHRVRKNFSQLVREGFDPELLDQVGASNERDNDSERHHRLNYIDDNPDRDDDIDESMREFWVHECYLWIDADNDGIAEYRNIVFIGDTIFHNEETDYQPFVASSAIVNTHRHIGMSLVETMLDIERYATQLKRALINNANKANNPRKYVGRNALDQQSGLTLQMLMDTHAEHIPVNDPNAIVPEQFQSVISEILPALQMLEQDKKLRSGVAPEMNMDPDILKHSTAQAFLGAMDQASQRIEMMTRILAETGVKKIFQKFHQLMRMSPDPETTIKIRNQYVEVDPTSWQERTNITVEVGLGYQAKAERIQGHMQLLQVQREAMQAQMVGPEHLFHSFDKLVESMGLEDAQRYFRTPDQIPPPEDPTQSPEYQVLMAEAQKTIAEAQEKLAETERENEELRGKLAETGAKIENLAADTSLKSAQTVKTLAEAASGGAQR